MDLDYTHTRLIASLEGIAAGKGVEDTVLVPPYGKSTKIFTALNDAAKQLDETFAADHLPLVDQALFETWTSRARSSKKNEVALTILTALVPPKKAAQ